MATTRICMTRTGRLREGRCCAELCDPSYYVTLLVPSQDTLRKVSRKVPAESDAFPAAALGDEEWLRLSLQKARPPLETNHQGLTVLHVACLHGRLACIELLVDSGLVGVNASCPAGRRPVHMVLSAHSSAHTYRCLTYLLQHRADVNTATTSGQTPLHLASAEGLMDCVEALVKAGADVHARDIRGHTPLDYARTQGRKTLARYLKDRMWQAGKKEELGRRRQLQTLYRDLVDLAKINEANEKVARKTQAEDNMEEWASKKGLPPVKGFCPRVQLSRYHATCLSSERDRVKTKQTKAACKNPPGGAQEHWNASTNPARPVPGSVSRPVTVHRPDIPPVEPDLRGSITLSKSVSGRPQYTTKWDGLSHAAPHLPLDTLQRALFPKAFLSRMASSGHFQPRSVLDLPRLGGPHQEKSASPWTEVAMHLAEVLEPGHY
ncbi:ankyrin repeat domain-containing protein 53 [Lampris incognitus]|uniref:ankyrin repeat domain-containing protein 53 n=1 Tax=Lampris incognitus TaxID=2546036 RepID=UPI0024B48A1F|nr:ankyrin repeat domain-containing protein 53 [Lampris incognitus]